MYILFNSFWGVDRPLGLSAHAVYPVLIMIIDKMIFTDTPKSREVVDLRLQFLPIMLALCSMLLPCYYAQNYAGIIGSSLLLRQ